MGTSRYTDYKSVNWDIPIWSPDWKQVDSLLTNQEQGYQAAQQALNAPIDASSYGNDPLLREQLRLNRQQAENDLALTYKSKGVNAGNKALQGYLYQLQQDKNPGGTEYQLMANKKAIQEYNDKIDKAEGWSPEDKKLWFAYNMTDYKGSIQGDSMKGFSGQDISKFINVSEQARKLMKEMTPKTTEGFLDPETGNIKFNTGGKAVYAQTINGQAEFYWDKAKNIKLTPQEMVTAVLPALQSDNEVQTYLKDKSQINLFGKGVTKDNWQPLLQNKKEIINSTISKIDELKDDKSKKELISQMSGKSIEELSKYKSEDLNEILKSYKAEYQLERIKTNNITSFGDLINSESEKSLEGIVKDNSKIYERDDFFLSSEHWLNQFALKALEESYKKKEEKTEEEFDPSKMWIQEDYIGHIPMKIPKTAQDYNSLISDFNTTAEEMGKQFGIINYQYNTALKDPKNEFGNILRKAGWDFNKNPSFIEMRKDDRTGIYTVEKSNFDNIDISKLSGEEQQALYKTNQSFQEQVNALNALRDRQFTNIQMYQKFSGDTDIGNNLSDINENILVDPVNKITQQGSYKRLNENLSTSSQYSPEKQKDLEEKAIKALGYTEKDKPYHGWNMAQQLAIQSKKAEIYKKEQQAQSYDFIKNNYQSYVEEKKKQGEKPFSLQDLLDPKKYGEQEFIKTMPKNMNITPLGDLSYTEKVKKYETALSLFKEEQAIPGNSYRISDLAFTDSKMKKVARETYASLGSLITQGIIDHSLETKDTSVVYLDGLKPISTVEERNAITKALAKIKLPDENDDTKLQQGGYNNFSIKEMGGKFYGVASLVFEDPIEINGVKRQGTNVAFEINDSHKGLKDWIIMDQKLFSEQQLQDEKDNIQQLSIAPTSRQNFSLPSSKISVTTTRTVDGDDNNLGFYDINLFANVGDIGAGYSTKTIAKIQTNNPNLGSQIKDYIYKSSLGKDKLATVKAVYFGGDEDKFKQSILQEVNQMAGGKINETSLNQIYEYLIKPEIKDGKPQLIVPSENFINPQGFKW